MTPFALRRLGLSVIPVPRPNGRQHDGKRPSIAWREFQTRLPTGAEMQRWFGDRATNLAVITGGVSGVVVVDVDSEEAVPWVREHLPQTPWIVRTRRGWHLYYRHPGVPVGNRAHLGGMKLDVRGDGGYVIGPGSLHASGAAYRAIGDWTVPREKLPVLEANLLAKLAKPAQPQLPPMRATGNEVERGRRYLAKVPRPIDGQGSDRDTFVVACALVQKIGVPPHSALFLMHEWAPDFDLWWIRRKVAAAAQLAGLA